MYIQWNLFIKDTAGSQLAVLYREVSLIQRQICTQVYVVGTADSVLIRDVSFVQSVFCREVPLYVSVEYVTFPYSSYRLWRSWFSKKWKPEPVSKHLWVECGIHL